MVTTEEGFFTGSTGTANILESNIAASLEKRSPHFSSRSPSSSDLGLLLDLDFLLLDLGESSVLFLLPGWVSDFLAVFSPSTRPNTLTREGFIRVGMGEAETFLSLFFLSL